VGIKPGTTPDCAVVACTTEHPASVAAVFTQNLAAAAPVQVSRAHLAASAGVARGVVITSGNANAATGVRGLAGATGLCAAVGRALGAPTNQVLVAQTGLIGVPFDFSSCEPAVAKLCATLGSEPDGASRAANAILTTDTRPKTATVEADGFRVGAMAKGAAMLAPNLATMLAIVTTDAACPPDLLHELLVEAAASSFNRIHVDGDTSTNDTVVVLASGLAGEVPAGDLGDALSSACGSLALQMVDDAEGSTKTAIVTVRGARSDAEAHAGARAVASSLLVKCSLNGEDPYWGRVVSALGSAGIGFDPLGVAVAYGETTVCRGGEGVAHDTAAVAGHLAGRQVALTCDLGLGEGTAAMLCCDLGIGYLEENRTTS
jgi:glutamate N-acetyltransferase/amino-acid N-acetyltransferase